MDSIRLDASWKRARSTTSKRQRLVFPLFGPADCSPPLDSSPSSCSQERPESKDKGHFSVPLTHGRLDRVVDLCKEAGLSKKKGSNVAHCRMVPNEIAQNQPLDTRDVACKTFQRRDKSQKGMVASVSKWNSIPKIEQAVRIDKISGLSTSNLVSEKSLCNKQRARSILLEDNHLICLDKRRTSVDFLDSSKLLGSGKGLSAAILPRKDGYYQSSSGIQFRNQHENSTSTFSNSSSGTDLRKKVHNMAWNEEPMVEHGTPVNGNRLFWQKNSCNRYNRGRQCQLVQTNPDKDDNNSSGEVSLDNPNLDQEVKHSVMHSSGLVKHSELLDNTTQPVRKSSRVPKKRILDWDEHTEIDMRRVRKKKLENEPPEVAKSFAEGKAQHGLRLESNSGPCKRQDRKIEPESCSQQLDEKREVSLTVQQQVLRTSKEGADIESVIGVTNLGRESAAISSRRLEEVLSKAEQAIKKEEATRRRKLQMEKNAREIQEIAIQKILGESSRMKREKKLQKQREDMEQEKEAAALNPAMNTVRLVMGPCGNVVSFSKDLALPKIFSGPCSYPQERERCAGPSCNNAYKYRDAKTLLPLCSLECYKAVRNPPETAPAF